MSDLFTVGESKNTIIFGAGHGIGFALVKEILDTNPGAKVIATYRLFHKAKALISLSEEFSDRLEIIQLDPTIEKEVERFAQQLESKEVRLDLIVNSIGFLGDDIISPEKSLRDISKESLLKYFEVNSLPILYIAKNFEKLFVRERTTCFVNLSAKVGSIDDNALGGWYGYRASKTALNMFIKNVSIEFSRKRKKIITLALHPGTTHTELSEKYLKSSNLKIHEAGDTARNILRVLDSLSLAHNGHFLSWDGQEIKW